jgi:hypothetical protein
MTTGTSSPSTKRTSWIVFALILAFFTLTDAGALGSIDATRRAQTTQWMWGAGPSTIANDTLVGHDWVLPGRNGQNHYWYGMGQSLLMMPADIVFTLAARQIRLAERMDDVAYHRLRRAFISITTFPVIAAICATGLLALLQVAGLGFGPALVSAVVGVFCTRLLFANHSHLELSQHLALLLWAFAYLVKWTRAPRVRDLTIASVLLGVNLLFRLPFLANMLAVGVLFVGWQWICYPGQFRWRVSQIALVSTPIVGFFLLLDRLYHYSRFGEIFSTYLGIQIRVLLAKGLVAEGWPWEMPFLEGFLSHFISSAYGILWFDLLLIPTFYLFFRARKLIDQEFRFLLASFVVILLIDCVFYARYYSPGGMYFWGDRYVAIGAILITLLACPFYIVGRHGLTEPERIVIISTFVVSGFEQVLSMVFNPVLELSAPGGSGSIVPLARLRNVMSYYLCFPEVTPGLFSSIDYGGLGPLDFFFPKLIDQLRLGWAPTLVLKTAWLAAVVGCAVGLAQLCLRQASSTHGAIASARPGSA